MTQIKVMLVLIELIDQSEREKKNSKIHVQTSLYGLFSAAVFFVCLDKQATKQTNHALLVASQY